MQLPVPKNSKLDDLFARQKEPFYTPLISLESKFPIPKNVQLYLASLSWRAKTKWKFNEIVYSWELE